MKLALDGGTPVRQQPLDYRRGVNLIGDEERAAVLEVLESRSLFRYYGPDLRHKVDAFEQGVSELLTVPHTLATSSGTAALRAGLAALGVGPGDEVVVPALTFIASANAVVTSGAVPVFADVDTSLGLDPESLRACLSPRTAAVMPVHLENVVCDMGGVLSVAGQSGVPVLEDACQAIGTTYRGAAAGSLGAMGAFSLQLEKNITAGEGGVLVTSDPDLHLLAARYTDQGGQFVTAHGGTRGSAEIEPFVGENLRMAELGGAVAGAQLRRLPGLLDAMRANKAKLLGMIGQVEGLVPRWVPDPDGEAGSSVTWFAPDASVATRFVDALLAEGIPSARLYDGDPVYANRSILERRTVTPKRSPWAAHPVEITYAMGMCPRAEDLASRSIIVPVGPGYTAGDLDDVATAFTKVAAALL